MLIRSRINQQEKGKSLFLFLSERFRYLTPEQWLERINEGRFTIDGVLCQADRILRQGEILLYDCPPFPEPEADLNFSILLETEQFLAINKPGNLLVHKKGAAITHNLIYQLRENHTPRYPTADIVNRLDRETSGIVLVSKNKEALRELSALFSDRKVSKEYWAIVKGSPEQPSGTITAPIMNEPSEKPSSRQIISNKGKNAITNYELLSHFENRSLLKLYPLTGRTHQLRVHCASMGCPILGDKLYGMSPEQYDQWRTSPESVLLEFPRQALHCRKLTFTFRGREWHIEAPLPDDMRKIMPNKNITE